MVKCLFLNLQLHLAFASPVLAGGSHLAENDVICDTRHVDSGHVDPNVRA